MSRVIEINELNDLSGYRLAWDYLLRQTPGASFFHTLDWLDVYWRHFGAGQRLRVLVVLSNDRPIGIVPLCVRTERYRAGPLRVLTYPLHDWATYYGPIGPNRTATLLTAMRHVHQSPRDWDLLELRWTDHEQHDRGRTKWAMQAVGFGCDGQPWATTAVVRLDGTWDEYLASRSPKWRANRLRAERRLAQCGTVTYVRYRPPGALHGDGDPRWDLWDACQQVAGRSWQSHSTSGTTLTHGSVRPFLAEAHAAAARRGMLDLNLLWLDGRPIAFGYNYHHEGSVIGLRMGFDARLAATGCGNVLQARMIQDSFARGDQRYELGPGTLRFKCRYGTHLETCYRYTHFPPMQLRTVALRLKRRWDAFWRRRRGAWHRTQSTASALACPSRNSFCTAASLARTNSGPGA
ncbi:MAG: hypothetical protein A2W31_14840 [Planctomycetes bacterium RBG_16_64_10]|nr:MAG: hypothetical protein A2W31_14840 [Planctomycetes bacterium RBG_16_64_10]